jgi:nitrite reductase (NO-forming)
VVTQPRSGRATWHRRANFWVLAYLAAGVVTLGLHAAGIGSTWLVVHTFLLGAVTNAIVIWTHHFVTTLLHARPAPQPFRVATLMVLNAAILAILVGVSGPVRALTVGGAVALAVVVIAHGVMLAGRLAAAGQQRFEVTAWFYCAAAVALLVAVGLGTAMTAGVATGWYARLVVAHVELNVFGWIALTVLGTEVSFWPMVLRTRVVASAERAARHGLLVCSVGLIVVLAGALAATRFVVVIGLACYLAGVVRCLDPFVRTAAQRNPHTPAGWMLALANSWFVVGVVTDLAVAARSADIAVLGTRLESFVPWLIVGFVVQILMGALSYLLPVVLGRGPTGGRLASSWLDRFALPRLLLFNIGVAVVALRMPQPLVAIGWWFVVLAVAFFVVLAAAAFGATRGASPPVAQENPRD